GEAGFGRDVPGGLQFEAACYEAVSPDSSIHQGASRHIADAIGSMILMCFGHPSLHHVPTSIDLYRPRAAYGGLRHSEYAASARGRHLAILDDLLRLSWFAAG
ncbi:MAG: hypothetical protein OXU20_16665, partial [Myxococcales bacterium]|nr:hypothetical protein [Myxococcales bacterium]